DWQSYNDIYGVTNNPYDLGRTPGGSSGGSSAALAAGYGPLSLRSDIRGPPRPPGVSCRRFSAHTTSSAVPPPRPHPPPLPTARPEGGVARWLAGSRGGWCSPGGRHRRPRPPGRG